MAKTSLLDIAAIGEGARVQIVDGASEADGQLGSVTQWERDTVHVRLDGEDEPAVFPTHSVGVVTADGAAAPEAGAAPSASSSLSRAAEALPRWRDLLLWLG